MINAVRTAIAFLFLTQVISFSVFAETESSDAANSMDEAVDGADGYDVLGSVKKARESIAAQKKELENKEAPDPGRMVEEDEVAARREIYEQEIIQDIEMQQPKTNLELSLQRERLRRDLMAEAGRETELPFKLRRKLNLRLSQAYDDNIYLTKSNKKDDYITKVAPSILFSLNSKYIALETNYIMEYTRYEHRKDQGGLSHLMNLYIKPGSIKLPFFRKRGGKIGFTLQDDFQPLVTSVATSEQTSRTERTSNNSLFTIDYFMSAKRTLSLEYKNIYQRYKTSSMKSFSYNENSISPDIYFHVSPKWSLFAGYEYGRIDYFQGGTNSSDYQNLKGGVTGRLFNKVLAHLEIGQQWRHYTKVTPSKNISKPFFKSAFLNKFAPSTKGSLQFNHTIEESSYTGNEYYLSDEIDIDLEHGFTYKTKGSVGLSLIRNSYDDATTENGVTKKRKDVLIEPNVRVKYFFKKWFTADLSYMFRKRISNFSDFSYVDNRIIAAVNIGF